ncbi:MAG: PKD domain-containing protein [Desulfoprunum sp.]|uniref:PKD domain-containing protein n=1 Tax=Desulfoprunum sp. TaxID=2020866 RepID=UPI003C7738B0
MQHTLIRILFALLCSLPFSASATTQSIHVEWGYTPPTEPAVTGFKLYQEGVLACETKDPKAAAMDCSVPLATTTTNFTLTATFNDGTESPHSAPFVFTLSDSLAPLQAVIATAPLSGPAPFKVDFNATFSTGSISSFQWDFGDGSTATGSIASHEYTTAGTYTAKLTVTDTAGQTSTTTTSVTATAPVIQPLPPTAVISSSTAAGPAPLVVNFDASGSKAAAGANIASYSWSFGDGSPTTTGVSDTASHTFATVGTYSTTLTVTDSKGLTSSISTPVVVDAATSGDILVPAVQDDTDSANTDPTITTPTSPPEDQQATSMKIEMGEIDVDGDWGHVDLDLSNFQNPVVIVGPAGSNDTAPGVIRLRNVDATGFDIKFAEWDYQDGTHPEETVSYLVMEKGRTILPDGSIIEAGTFTGAPTNQNIRYNAPFNKVPVVLTTVASENETDTISGRLSKITTSSFAYYFKEQEKNKNVHVKETVNFIAWEPGMGMIGTVQFEVAKTAAGLTDSWGIIPFQQTFERPPLFLADMQTNNNTDTSTLRSRSAAPTGASVNVEEEQSKDLETSHPEEMVGYISLDQEE